MSSSNYILALNGEAILLKNPSVSIEDNIEEEDQSGQSSNTTASEQGQKAKILNVSGLIEYASVDVLTHLFTLASARDESGRKKCYRVANQLAQAVKFREAVFFGKINAQQDPKFMAWNISFSLKERFSVAEKRESIEQPVNNELVIADDVVPTEKEENLSGFEQALKSVDNKLG